MNIAYLQFNFIEKSSPYSSVPLYHNTAGPEAFLMARERKNIKFAALAFPPCYLLTGLVFFLAAFFFFCSYRLFHCTNAALLYPKKEDSRYIFKCKIHYKEEESCNQRIPQYDGLVGAINLAKIGQERHRIS